MAEAVRFDVMSKGIVEASFGSLTQVLHEFLPGRRLVLWLSVQSASIIFLDLLGAVAQLGERLICIQEVAGSIPTSSTKPHLKVPTRLGL